MHSILARKLLGSHVTASTEQSGLDSTFGCKTIQLVSVVNTPVSIEVLSIRPMSSGSTFKVHHIQSPQEGKAVVPIRLIDAADV